MRHASLKLKSYSATLNRSMSIVHHGQLERYLLRYMLFALGILAFAYVYMLGNMVFNIVERRAFEAEARTLSSEVGMLELQYLSLSNKIDLSYAKSMGFKETDAKFANRKSAGEATALGGTSTNLKASRNEL